MTVEVPFKRLSGLMSLSPIHVISCCCYTDAAVVVSTKFAATIELTCKIKILFLCVLTFLSFLACLLGAGKLALKMIDNTYAVGPR